MLPERRPGSIRRVLIVGERIAEIGPMEQVPIPSGAHVIDASGMTVMPGLMDSNQHIVLNPMYSTPDISLPLDQFRKRWEYTWSRMEREAYTFLMQGITGFRQTPGPADRILAMKRKIDAGEIAGPRIHLGGALWPSKPHWERHLKANRQTDPAAVDFVKHHFEYNVVEDLKNLDPNGWGVERPDFNFWKLYLWEEPFNGKNDFTDEELRYLIDRAHKPGKILTCTAAVTATRACGGCWRSTWTRSSTRSNATCRWIGTSSRAT